METNKWDMFVTNLLQKISVKDEAKKMEFENQMIAEDAQALSQKKNKEMLEALFERVNETEKKIKEFVKDKNNEEYLNILKDLQLCVNNFKLIKKNYMYSGNR